MSAFEELLAAGRSEVDVGPGPVRVEQAPEASPGGPPRALPVQHSSTHALVWSTAALPLVWLALFGLFVVRARLALGVWPQPYRPDPKDLGFDVHHMLVALLLPLILVTPVVLVPWTILFRKRLRTAGLRPWLVVSVTLLLSAAAFALTCIDPGQFLEWYFD